MMVYMFVFQIFGTLSQTRLTEHCICISMLTAIMIIIMIMIIMRYRFYLRKSLTQVE